MQFCANLLVLRSELITLLFRPGSASSVNGSIRSDDEPDGDQINVVVRVRPLNARGRGRSQIGKGLWRTFSFLNILVRAEE
jgi:hypothetical protein